MRVRLPHQFTVHLVETLNCIRYAIGHFEMVAESIINRESRGGKLQANEVSGQRGGTRTKEDTHIESGYRCLHRRYLLYSVETRLPP